MKFCMLKEYCSKNGLLSICFIQKVLFNIFIITEMLSSRELLYKRELSLSSKAKADLLKRAAQGKLIYFA